MTTNGSETVSYTSNWNGIAAGNDAASLPWRASGYGPTAIVRTVDAKLHDLGLTAKDYGAVADGVTDDQATLQAGINAAKAGATSFDFTEPSTYRWTAPLEITGLTVTFDPAAQMVAPYVPWQVNGTAVYGRAVTGTGVGPKSARINHAFRKNLVVIGDAVGATGDQRSGETMIVDVSGRCSDSPVKAFAYNTYVNYGLYEGVKNNSEGTVACYNGRITVYDLVGASSAGSITEVTPLANGVVCQWDSKPVQTWQQKNGNYYNDIVMHGPVTTSSADRENYLSGMSIYASKWSPGTAQADGFHGAYGLTIHTDAKGGGFGGNNASGRDSYVLNAGIAIQGWSGVQGVALAGGHDPAAQAGYDVGLKIGGSYASVWTNWAEVGSRLNTGITVEDYQTTGIWVKSSHFGGGNPGLKVDAPVFFQHGNNEPKLNIGGYGASLGQGVKFVPTVDAAEAATFHNASGAEVGRIVQSAAGVVYEAGIAGGFAFAGGPTWTAGTGAPTATQPVGSIYSRTDGTAGARLYVSAGGGTWAAVAGV